MGTFSYLNQISMIMYYFMIIFLGISSVQGCVPIPPSPPSPQDSLPSLTSVDPNEISVGGFSSGASFATQFHVANSAIIKGVGIHAGLPFGCALQESECYFYHGSIEDELSVDKMVEAAKNLAAQNLIDSTSNLGNTKVYIAHGTQDSVVKPIYGQKILEFYQGLVTNANDIVPVFNISAEHGVISNRRGTPCGEMNLQTFVENCNEDTIKEMFNHVYSNMNNPKPDGDLSNTLKSFSQGQFFDIEYNSMSENGYYYVPSSCTEGNSGCRLHVFFHGCTMSSDNIGTAFIENSGLLEMADANKIVLIFPNIKTDWFMNPHGCWNFKGYLGDLNDGKYATKDGIQMRVIKNMISKVLGQDF